jgi:hypothetical protein
MIESRSRPRFIMTKFEEKSFNGSGSKTVIHVFLKVGTNERVGESGRWQMFEIVRYVVPGKRKNVNFHPPV